MKRICKRIISVALVAMVLLAGAPMSGFVGLDLFTTVNAMDIVGTGSCGSNVNYTLYSDGNLVISGTGKMTNFWFDHEMHFHGDDDYCSSPFFGNSNIKSITIQDGVTSVGDYSFWACSEVTSVNIADSVTYIGAHSFEACTKLESITIPENIKTISELAFADCTALTEIKFNAINADDLSFSDGVFSNAGTATNGITVTFGNNVNKIPSCLFLPGQTSVRPKLANVVFGNSVTQIGNNSFENCTLLTSLILPDSLTKIGFKAFAGCTGLQSITIPENVTTIGSEAFSSCTALTGINYNAINALDFEFENCVFSNAGSLKSGISVVFGDNVKSIPAFIFYDYSGSKPNIKNITIGSNVESIGEGAFWGCKGITSVSIGSKVSQIGYSAFMDCTGLTNVTFEDGISNVGDGAFSYCTNLTTLNIPNSVTYIGECAFEGCERITDVYYSGLESDWIHIYVGECNEGLLNATIHYATVEHIHTVTTQTVDATCTEDGYIRTYCSECNEIISNEVIPALGHSFGEWTVTTPATVENEGVESRECSRCEQVETRAIDRLIDTSEIIESGSCGDNATYTLDVDGNLVISGTGEMYDYYLNEEGYFASGEYYCSSPFHERSIKSITIQDGVTSIGSYSFWGCGKVTNVSIADSVTNIGSHSFTRCCELESITISENVNTIGNLAFAGCSKLTEINFNAYNIDDFSDYNGIFSCAGTSADGITVVFGNRVNKIPGNLFNTAQIDYMKYMVLTDYSARMDYEYYCDENETNILNVVFGNSVTEIGDGAFANCINIKNISFPNTITKIGNSAFSGCTGLQSITIPENVTEIGNGAFMDCTNIKSITLPNMLTKIGGSVFSGCTGLSSIAIPENVTEIGGGAFANCTNIKNISFPNSLTKIGGSAFAGCTGLQSITIPENVTTIGSEAFSNCTALTTLNISNSVTYIGECAFEGCERITDVYYSGSESAWNNIYIELYNNESLLGATIHYATVEHIHTETTQTVEATCTEDGYIITYCSECNETISNEVIPALGHSFGEWTTAVPADCTTNGARIRICSKCLHFESKTIPATGHTVVTDEAVAPTCTTAGLTEGSHCSVCGTVLAEQQAVPMAEHELGEYTTILVPTCTSKGVQIRFCDNCRHYETKVIEATGHTFGEWIVVAHATVQSLGYQERECSVCGFKETEIIDKVTPPSLNMNSVSVDEENRLIYDLTPGLNSFDGFITTDDADFEIVPVAKDGKFGTGSMVEILKDGVVVDEYTIVIFGDSNGDGWYDGMDAFTVSCIANELLTREQVGEAVWLAADCNHDGVIDCFDVQLLEQAGILLASVDQTMSAQELIETSAYQEYIQLIDQNPDVDIEESETSEPTEQTPTEPTSEQPNQSAFEKMIEFIFNIINWILSFFK